MAQEESIAVASVWYGRPAIDVSLTGGSDEDVRKSAVALLNAGCRYFVCFGERSEEVHDCIDDCIVEKSLLDGSDYEGAITTYHVGESVADVAEFFLNCAVPDMQGALALVGDKQQWSAALQSVINDG